MNPLDISEPLLQYICRLNRSARKGGNYELAQVQADLKAILAEAKTKAAAENLADHHEKTELPLLFFCDFMIKESALPWAHEWKELAHERQETTGNEKFFELLEQTIQDKSPAATQRLTVFYTCIGLGFTGSYTGQPEHLRRKMKEIAARLQSGPQLTDASHICPDSYEKVDTRNLVEPPGAKLVGIAIALIGLVCVLFVVYGYLYRDSARRLTKALQTVENNSTNIPAAPAAAGSD